VGFREPLDLSVITSQYGVLAKEAQPEPEIDRSYLSHRPVRVNRSRPSDASTCTAVLPSYPTFSWDANGYYRRLQAPWPYVHVTKGWLAKSYQRLDGQRDPMKTYALKQLLNPKVREAYDRTPLGERYLDDDFVQEMLRRSASDEAVRRRLAGEDVDADDIMNERYVIDDGEPDSEQAAQDRRTAMADGRWDWSYYMWGFEQSPDVESQMEQWQSMVIEAIALTGARIHVSVGVVVGHPALYVLSRAPQSSCHTVFLRSDVEPSKSLARQAALELINLLYPN
jgi:hypothetical protein